MPTATAPTEARHRIVLQPLPPRSEQDLARLRKIAARARPGVATIDAPDAGDAVRFLEVVRPYDVLPVDIEARTLAWFQVHGGNRAINRALRAYMREHGTRAIRRRTSAPSVSRVSR